MKVPITGLEEILRKRCPSLHGYFETIKEFCLHYWQTVPIVHRHYTIHDVRHTHRIIEHIEDILPQCTVPLNIDEIYVLLSSVYLHDIAMQFPQYAINKKDITNMTYDDYEVVRSKHRQIIKRVIEGDLFDYFYRHTRHRHFPYHSFMARICEDHNQRGDRQEFYEEIRVIGGVGLRIKLLTALLQYADALHIGDDRISSELNTGILPLKSRKFWWKNYYVREVLVDSRYNRVSVHYEIPYKFLPHMEEFSKFAECNFQGYSGDALDVLWDHGIRIKVGGHEPWVMINDTKKLMPNNVISDMKKFLSDMDERSKSAMARSIMDTISEQCEKRICEEITRNGSMSFAQLSKKLPNMSKHCLEACCSALESRNELKKIKVNGRYRYQHECQEVQPQRSPNGQL